MRKSIKFELPRDVKTPSQARRLIAQFSHGELDEDELDRAKLLVSELVTNAVLHGRGTIMLRADLSEDRLLVEVIDEGSGFERLLDRKSFEDVGGWGLRIVEAQASRWGLHDGTSHVWFELERSGPRLGADKNPASDLFG